MRERAKSGARTKKARGGRGEAEEGDGTTSAGDQIRGDIGSNITFLTRQIQFMTYLHERSDV